MATLTPDLMAQLITLALAHIPPEMLAGLQLPPPVFGAMEGEITAFSAETASLTARFPVKAWYQNPMGYMQGGMITAAIDNALGPLSFLVAPPNVTRTLEMTYIRPITPDHAFIDVQAQLAERDARKLIFTAQVRDEAGKLLARCRAVHWIVDALR